MRRGLSAPGLCQVHLWPGAAFCPSRPGLFCHQVLGLAWRSRTSSWPPGGLGRHDSQIIDERFFADSANRLAIVDRDVMVACFVPELCSDNGPSQVVEPYANLFAMILYKYRVGLSARHHQAVRLFDDVSIGLRYD